MNIAKVIKEGTKKEYTYLTEMEVKEGDRVVAEFGKSDAILVVVGVGELDQDGHEALGYPLKTIKGFADEIEVKPAPTIDIMIEEEQLPIIAINFDQIKENLTNILQKYQGVIVTEQTLNGAKTTQKELAGLRGKIERYRIDKKKELSVPIVNFESQCKELVGLIGKAETPINEGIKVFDDKKKDGKKQVAETLKQEVVLELGLDERFSGKLTLIDKYSNLGAKEKDVREDLFARGMTLKVEQDREKELAQIIEDSIKAENTKIKQQMSISDFKNLIKTGASTATVLDEIRKKSEMIFRAENPPIRENISQPLNPKPVIQVANPIKQACLLDAEPAANPSFYASYRVIGTHEELLSVSEFLKSNSIMYSVIEQGEI